MSIHTKIDAQDKIGTAVRYQNPKGSRWFRNSAGRKLYIEPDALKYIQNLNGYDQHQVCKGIEALASVPAPLDGMVNQQRPAFLKAKEASSTAFNFIIKYSVTSSVVMVTQVRLNRVILGSQSDPRDERSALYRVKRVRDLDFGEGTGLEQSRTLPTAWAKEVPVTSITTAHAAVNGMLNDLHKARWLMGVHVRHAYKPDNVESYTLFHNPSESGLLDFYESVRDNLGLATQNARYLAAALADVQRKGQPVKWVVHSQGGIIFKQAIKHHIRTSPGQMLDKNSVVFHAGGNNKKVTDKLLVQVGIRKNAPDNDNPFDLVPALAGGNDLSLKAIRRTVDFWEKVKGSETSYVLESPHTLPFISLEAYRNFLVIAGDTASAEKVTQHMAELTKH